MKASFAPQEVSEPACPLLPGQLKYWLLQAFPAIWMAKGALMGVAWTVATEVASYVTWVVLVLVTGGGDDIMVLVSGVKPEGLLVWLKGMILEASY